jgi:hypothetical protein
MVSVLRMGRVSAVAVVFASSLIVLASPPAGAIVKNGLKAPTSNSVQPHFTVPNCTGSGGLTLEESCLNGILYSKQTFEGNAANDIPIFDSVVEPKLLNFLKSQYTGGFSYWANTTPAFAAMVMRQTLGYIMNLANSSGVFPAATITALENPNSSLLKTDIPQLEGFMQSQIAGIELSSGGLYPLSDVSSLTYDGVWILSYAEYLNKPSSWWVAPLKAINPAAMANFAQNVVDANEAAIGEEFGSL